MADPKKALESRIDGEYMSAQYRGRVEAKTHSAHKSQLAKGDQLYNGSLTSLFPNEGLPETPLVENKFKNALHDITRLATEARPVPAFLRTGDSDTHLKQKDVRGQIADTIWEMGDGPVIEDQLYMDLLGAAYMAVACFYNDESEYAQFVRLDPRLCYPSIRNGKLVDMLYVETMSRAIAATEYPDLNISPAAAKKEYDKSDQPDPDITICTLYTKTEITSAVLETSASGKKVTRAEITAEWVHRLGCVPVGFTRLAAFDGAFHGMFDQLGGPMMVRNKIINYLQDYMEDMVHAPFEAKNVMNSEDRPGPLTIYQHDPNADESFMRRVAPAAPAGSVFGLLSYMDDQESKESIQPPSRVGSVSQSIASGSFVASTQGGLSSAVKEAQKLMGHLRRQVHYICFKIEEKHLDNEKPLLRAVGKKSTYTPSKDIKGIYAHRILFGAAAGLDRQYADTRVLQFQGAGYISKETARAQIDFLDDATSEQDQIDLEQSANVMFQRMMADPNVPLAIIAQLVVTQSKGGGMIAAIEAVAPQLIELQEQQAAAAAPASPGGVAPPGAGPGPAEEGLALDKGAVPEGEGGPSIAPISPFDPPPLQQQIVTTR